MTPGCARRGVFPMTARSSFSFSSRSSRDAGVAWSNRDAKCASARPTMLDGVDRDGWRRSRAEGERLVRLEREIDPYRGGRMPLPPYIERPADAEDETRYQTVFARAPGAVAAPTAGLHFTPEILAQLPHAFVTLHVGTGTFRPVQSETIAEHRMHAERFAITSRSGGGDQRGGDAFSRSGRLRCGCWNRRDGATASFFAQEGATDIFIYPPYRVSRRRSVADEFPPAALDSAHAGGGVCRPRVCPAGLCGSGARTLSLLQLRRLHADPCRPVLATNRVRLRAIELSTGFVLSAA